MSRKIAMKIPSWIWVLFIVFVGAFLLFVLASKKSNPASISTQNLIQKYKMRSLFIGNKANIQLELADTPDKIVLGLSYRESLPENQGMLFVFSEPHIPTFWMYEMKFPLDMIWIGEDNTIIDITENVPYPSPGTGESDLPRYSPKTAAKMVLEVNAGFVKKNNITVGDIITVSL